MSTSEVSSTDKLQKVLVLHLRQLIHATGVTTAMSTETNKTKYKNKFFLLLRRYTSVIIVSRLSTVIKLLQFALKSAFIHCFRQS